jgi:hypothetical protein
MQFRPEGLIRNIGGWKEKEEEEGCKRRRRKKRRGRTRGSKERRRRIMYMREYYGLKRTIPRF